MISIKPHVPSSTIVPEVSSSSKHVIKSRFVEIPASINGSYSFSTNSRITVDINSPTDFIDFTQSYLRFDMTCSMLNNGSDEPSRYLSEGGAHCLFRTVEITTAGGVRIQRIENYNRFNAIMSTLTQSRDWVKHAQHREGDSDDINSIDSRTYYANTADAKVCLQLNAPFFSMPEWVPLFLIRGGLRLNMDMERPEFCLASNAVPAGTGFSGVDVVLKNVKFVCKMIQPDESLAQSYLAQYKGEGIVYSFLNYNFHSFVDAGNAGFESHKITSGVRSARHFLARIQDSRAQTVSGAAVDAGKSTFTADSIAQGRKAGLEEFQLESGSERYPLAGPLICSSTDNSELWISAQDAVGVQGSLLSQPRCLPEQWREQVHTYADLDQGRQNGKLESDRLVLAVDLSRDASPYAGLDLSLNSLQCNVKYDAVFENVDYATGANAVTEKRYLITFVGYDSSLLLSEQAGVKLFQ